MSRQWPSYQHHLSRLFRTAKSSVFTLKEYVASSFYGISAPLPIPTSATNQAPDSCFCLQPAALGSAGPALCCQLCGEPCLLGPTFLVPQKGSRRPPKVSNG